jgi:hypothetical protein
MSVDLGASIAQWEPAPTRTEGILSEWQVGAFAGVLDLDDAPGEGAPSRRSGTGCIYWITRVNPSWVMTGTRLKGVLCHLFPSVEGCSPGAGWQFRRPCAGAELLAGGGLIAKVPRGRPGLTVRSGIPRRSTSLASSCCEATVTSQGN